MTEEQLLLEKVKKEAQDAVAKATENKANIEDLNKLIARLEAIEKSDIEAVKAEVIAVSAELAALKEKPKAEAPKSFRGALKAAFAEQKETIDAIVAKGGKQSEPLIIEIKSAVDMSVANTIGAGSTQISITENTGIISPIRQRTQTYLANVSVGSTSGNRGMWIEETDEQGTPIFIGEGVGKTKISVLYAEKTANVKKIAVYGKVTTEMLADIPQLISYIQNNLMKRMENKTEDQLLSGDNIGDNLNGVITVASAFSAGALANSVQDANEWDVLEAVATQVKLAYGMPNAIFVHPSTLQAMKAAKTSTGEPLWKYYQDSNNSGISVAGMKVIETPAITAGDFVGGDMTAVNVLFRENTTVQIGLDGSDFTNNKKTLLLEQRLVQFVSANDTPVIVKGSFDDAKAALQLV
jgi:HK97 family phage major capsid protein